MGATKNNTGGTGKNPNMRGIQNFLGVEKIEGQGFQGHVTEGCCNACDLYCNADTGKIMLHS